MNQFLSIVIIVSSIQAFFLSFHFILKSRGRKVLNYLVAVVTFSFFILLLSTYFNLNNINFSTRYFQDLANNIMWFVGPSLYLYVVYDESIENKKIITNFFPFLIPLILDLLFYWPKYDQLIPFVAYSQMLIYLFLSLSFCVKNYKHQKRFFYWVLPSILSFILLVIINFIFAILNVTEIYIIPDYIRLSLVILLTFPIFYIGYREMNSNDDFGIKSKKYKSTPISSTKSQLYLKKIMDAIEKDEIFKDIHLTLSSFSKKISIPSKYISQIVNENKAMSFPELITYYRIEDVKKSLIDPKNKHLTILGIAQESGFKSGSRFNTLFKHYTGLTPTSYRRKSPQ